MIAALTLILYFFLAAVVVVPRLEQLATPRDPVTHALRVLVLRKLAVPAPSS